MTDSYSNTDLNKAKQSIVRGLWVEREKRNVTNNFMLREEKVNDEEN